MRVRELVGIEREETDWKILAEPPADSTPDLTLSATVEEDVSEIKGDGGELTLGNMAVESVDDDGNPWRRHCVCSERWWWTLVILCSLYIRFTPSREHPCGQMTEPGFIFVTFRPRSNSNHRKNLPHPPTTAEFYRLPQSARPISSSLFPDCTK